MAQDFVTFDLDDLVVGEPLPGTVYLCIDFRFITFRASGDLLDRNAFDRLQVKGIRQVFIEEGDRGAFRAWAKAALPAPYVPATSDDAKLGEARTEARRKMMDIFLLDNPNKVAAEGLLASKKLVAEVMRTPLASRSLAQLQAYSRGTVDHSVNVSILSTYLAMNMGYSHALILQNIAAGALLHDFGKMKVELEEGDSKTVIAEKMKQHPTVGAAFVEAQDKVGGEIKMIIAQHHECFDGTGYPKGLKGGQIYDLARIVAIANVFDELVTEGRGPLPERQARALKLMGGDLAHRFDPQKLDKVLRILKLGL